MNRFVKLENSDWAVRLPLDSDETTGQQIVVTTRNGDTKTVTLGRYHLTDAFGRVFLIAPQTAAPKVTIGSLDGIIALFDRAAKNLKYPAVVLHVPGFDDGVRVSRAGARAKQPGTLNVTNGAKDDSEYGRTWFGRVGLDGSYSPSRDASPAIATALQAFAAEPAKVAAEYGRLTGICCFCRKKLTDERSTAVGYGKICAGHYGLPWGASEAAVDLDDGDVTGWAEQQAHYESATDGSYDGTKDYNNAARRERLTGYWSPRNAARYQD